MSSPYCVSPYFTCQFMRHSQTSLACAEHIHLQNFPKLVPIERTFNYESNDMSLHEFSTLEFCLANLMCEIVESKYCLFH